VFGLKESAGLDIALSRATLYWIVVVAGIAVSNMTSGITDSAGRPITTPSWLLGTSDPAAFTPPSRTLRRAFPYAALPDPFGAVGLTHSTDQTAIVSLFAKFSAVLT
jgi:hypothetical protein